MFGFGISFFFLIGIMIVSSIVGWRFQKKFEKYTKIPLSSGLTGKEVAERMLRDSGVGEVRITATPGKLTDHYNPADKTVNLSPDVYRGRSVAAAAVAAHECGHAIQHANQYSFLKLRSALVPAVSISSKFVPFLLLGGIFTMQIFPQIMLAGIILFAATTLFSFVTLPVEFDASRRALNWLNSAGITSSSEHNVASDALKGAAKTYVMAALASLATLLYYVMIFMGNQD